MCSYNSSTPTCTPSIPLYLGMVFRGTLIIVTSKLMSEVIRVTRVDWIVRITLIIVISLPSLEMNWPYSSVRRPRCGEVP